jgi:hypothetical protein
MTRFLASGPPPAGRTTYGPASSACRAVEEPALDPRAQGVSLCA